MTSKQKLVIGWAMIYLPILAALAVLIYNYVKAPSLAELLTVAGILTAIAGSWIVATNTNKQA